LGAEEQSGEYLILVGAAEGGRGFGETGACCCVDGSGVAAWWRSWASRLVPSCRIACWSEEGVLVLCRSSVVGVGVQTVVAESVRRGGASKARQEWVPEPASAEEGRQGHRGGFRGRPRGSEISDSGVSAVVSQHPSRLRSPNSRASRRWDRRAPGRSDAPLHPPPRPGWPPREGSAAPPSYAADAPGKIR
jgi:hypothetical protein